MRRVKLFTYAYPFNHMYDAFDHQRFDVVPCDIIRETPDLVLIPGGADVSPRLYGQKFGVHTNIDHGRDRFDIAIFNFCRNNRIPMLGICRGCQFLAVMAGAQLIQHINIERHYSMPHDVMDVSTKEFFVTNSTHHQAVNGEYPGTLEITALATSTGTVEAWKTTSATAFKAAAVQWHPELMTEWLNNRGIEYFNDLAGWVLS